MLRMLHPSSGRRNFKIVSGKPNGPNKSEESSAANNPSQVEYKTEIETKTNDAINDAIKSQSSNNPMTDKKN